MEKKKIKTSGRSFLSVVAGVLTGLAVLTAIPAVLSIAGGIFGAGVISGEAIVWGSLLATGFGLGARTLKNHMDQVRRIPMIAATVLTVALPFAGVYYMTHKKGNLPEKNKLEQSFNQSASKQDSSKTYQYSPQPETLRLTPDSK